MDKETLSNYGWIVILVLILAVMIALATPFGNFIAGAIKSTTAGFFSVNQNAMNAGGIVIPGQNFGESDNATPEAMKTPLHFREPYSTTMDVDGKNVELSMVFYEEGKVTMFANGSHNADYIYPVYDAAYEGTTIKLTLIDMADSQGWLFEGTVSEDGTEFVMDGMPFTLGSTYDIPIDIDLSNKSLSADFCIGYSSGGSEVEDPETLERIDYKDDELCYWPTVYPEDFQMMMDEIYPDQEFPEFNGIVKIYYNKDGLELVERDDVGHWEDYVWTFTADEIKNSTDVIKIKFIDYTDGVSSAYFNTSVGLILFES